MSPSTSDFVKFESRTCMWQEVAIAEPNFSLDWIWNLLQKCVNHDHNSCQPERILTAKICEALAVCFVRVNCRAVPKRQHDWRSSTVTLLLSDETSASSLMPNFVWQMTPLHWGLFETHEQNRQKAAHGPHLL